MLLEIDEKPPSICDTFRYPISLNDFTANADLTPLIHFWGVPPVEPNTLKSKINAKGLTPSEVIRKQLVRYRDIIAPKNKTEFDSHFMRVFPDHFAHHATIRNDCASPDYGCGWYHTYYASRENSSFIAH